jgi:hypothetical protein
MGPDGVQAATYCKDIENMIVTVLMTLMPWLAYVWQQGKQTYATSFDEMLDLSNDSDTTSLHDKLAEELQERKHKFDN